MKHSFFCLILAIQFINSGYCQNDNKPSLKLDDLGSWPKIYTSGYTRISDDGNYVLYFANMGRKEKNRIIVQSTGSSWEKEFSVNGDISSSGSMFSKNSKKVILFDNDSLFEVALGTDSVTVSSNIFSFFFPNCTSCDWIVYQSKNQQFILLNILDQTQEIITGAEAVWFNNNGNKLLVKNKKDIEGQISLSLFDLAANKEKKIWSSKSRAIENETSIPECIFDETGNQLAFLKEETSNGSINKSIWYYKLGMDSAVVKVDNRPFGDTIGKVLSGNICFSKSGKWIFFNVEEEVKNMPSKNAGDLHVDIWSYKDLLLSPEELLTKGRTREFYAVIDVSKSHANLIENYDERMEDSPTDVMNDRVIVMDNVSAYEEYWWPHSPRPSYWLTSLIDGSRFPIKGNCKELGEFSYSPDGEWLVFWDFGVGDYFSYHIPDNTIRNISHQIHLKIKEDYIQQVPPIPIDKVAGWLIADKSVLLYSNYDIFQVDLFGKQDPKSISRNYGIKHKTKLRIISPYNLSDETNIAKGDTLLLSAFNDTSKYNGFFKLVVGNGKDPLQLSMGADLYYYTNSQIGGRQQILSATEKPVKAKNTESWIVEHQSCKEAPNYYFTKDFVSFNKLSHLALQKKYNWLYSILFNFKMVDGNQSQGILYVPEDFNATKKYPVIITYYQKSSQNMFQFPYPHFTINELNIPWFVSNGYLVFTPDIYYSIASETGVTTGQSAYNSVVGAANFLSKLPYVRKDKLGIYGHSFGGLETCYLVTHSNKFAAASEMAGSTDPLSAYLNLNTFGSTIEYSSTQSTREMDHELYGTHPWKKPELYRNNSAVLSANNAVAPLLMVHNKKDGTINFRQGIELYMAFRRLGKKCWLLQYDGSAHSLSSTDGKDFSTRLLQFFNHFLKGSPPPKWLTYHRPSQSKFQGDGFDYDFDQAP